MLLLKEEIKYNIIINMKNNLTRLEKFKDKTPKEVFTQIFEECEWSSEESVSGMGSTLARTVSTRIQLPKLFEKFQIKRLLDVACGDFNWMKKIVNYLEYYKGTDIVDKLIESNIVKYGKEHIKFEVSDLTKEFPYTGEEFDAVLLKDVFVHFPNETIFSALKRIKSSGIKYIIVTNFTKIDENLDLQAFGQWRPINFSLPPFNFKKSIIDINERNESHIWKEASIRDKCLSMWETKNLK